MGSMRLLSGIAAALVVFVAAPAMGDAGFGTPPSGAVPIFYDDHHVYSRPDILRHDRVLAPLVRDGQILVPLRSMFESMGAVVSYDPSTKAVTARKPGADVEVRLGSNVVTIDGERRPLDVPPTMYHGRLLVPVRVIAEALGAYVEWLPDRRIVIVRFFTPTPPPTPSPEPSPEPTLPAPIPQRPAPTELPSSPPHFAGFVEGALTLHGKDYNEFGSGAYCRTGSYVLSAAYLFGERYALKIDSRQDRYVTASNAVDGFGNQLTVFSTIDGGRASTPVFLASQKLTDVRLAYRFASPTWYAGLGYVGASNNYGYPTLRGWGLGVDRMPELLRSSTWYASAYYYPSASGTYTVTDATSPNVGVGYRQRYAILTYDLGGALRLGRSAFYAYGGFAGDRYGTLANAPIDQTHSGFYAGIGVKL